MLHINAVVGSAFTYHEHFLTNGSPVSGQFESGETIDGIEQETPGIAFVRRSVKHAQLPLSGRSIGHGIRVDEATKLDAALAEALDSGVPFVVDVRPSIEEDFNRVTAPLARAPYRRYFNERREKLAASPDRRRSGIWVNPVVITFFVIRC